MRFLCSEEMGARQSRPTIACSKRFYLLRGGASVSQVEFEAWIIIVGMVLVIIGAVMVLGAGGFLISVGAMLIAVPVFARAGF